MESKRKSKRLKRLFVIFVLALLAVSLLFYKEIKERRNKPNWKIVKSIRIPNKIFGGSTISQTFSLFLSPSGDKLALLVSTDPQSENVKLYVIDLNDMSNKHFSFNDFSPIGDAGFSPDGEKILLRGYDQKLRKEKNKLIEEGKISPEKGRELSYKALVNYVINLTDGRVYEFRNYYYLGISPSWSEDSKKLLLVKSTPQKMSLVLLDWQNNEEKELFVLNDKIKNRFLNGLWLEKKGIAFLAISDSGIHEIDLNKGHLVKISPFQFPQLKPNEEASLRRCEFEPKSLLVGELIDFLNKEREKPINILTKKDDTKKKVLELFSSTAESITRRFFLIYNLKNGYIYCIISLPVLRELFRDYIYVARWSPDGREVFLFSGGLSEDYRLYSFYQNKFEEYLLPRPPFKRGERIGGVSWNNDGTLSFIVYKFKPRPVSSYYDFKLYKMAISIKAK
ncbi:hypothetical protein H5T88_01600 [bacterium]|nr:hypothetical protein [bacterium]